MGVTLYITLEKPIEGVELNEDRVGIGRVNNELNAIADKLGVRRIESFYSYEPDEVLYLIDDEDAREQLRETMEPVEYFDPAAGLKTVDALLEYISQKRPTLTDRGRDYSDRVVADLESCKTVLTAAAQHGVKFRMHPGE